MQLVDEQMLIFNISTFFNQIFECLTLTQSIFSLFVVYGRNFMIKIYLLVSYSKMLWLKIYC